jgi:tight adherence protein C
MFENLFSTVSTHLHAPASTYPVYRVLLVVLAMLCLGGTSFWISLRPSRSTSRLGMRGLKRQKALLRYPTWATIEPFVRWMSMRVGPILDSRSRAKLDAQLTYAGDFLGLSAEEYFACIVTSALAGACIGSLLAYLFMSKMEWIAVLGCAGVGAAIPHMIVDAARTQRFKAINRGLAYAIDMMALSMSAGLDFPSSVQQVVEKAKANEALREELAYLLQQLKLGNTRSQALRELAARVPIDCTREFAQALIQAEDRGNPVAAVLEVQAATARTRRSNLAEKAAHDIQSKMVLPIMMLIGVGLLLIAVPSTMMLEKFSAPTTTSTSATPSK